MNISFYKNKRVLITGHTGFKGSWMCEALVKAGANVTGYSLEAPTNPSLFHLLNLDNAIAEHIDIDEAKNAWSAGNVYTVIGDVRDLTKLRKVFEAVKPEIIIHMAAQPIVRESYKNPVYTYETNVMGTVNIMECVRLFDCVRSVVNVTTDKVYLNREWQWGYRENEELNGYDPYSNSKSCSELVTSSYKNSFFSEMIKAGRELAVTTMRAGNVIGGGDFATDRIIPDCIRAIEKNEDIKIRNRFSTRPYQHVLEPVAVYLMVAMKQYEDITLADSYNVGPDDVDCFTSERIVSLFCDKWNKAIEGTTLNSLNWQDMTEADAPHEANLLKLDCTKLKNTFDWSPVWNLPEVIDAIVEWNKEYLLGNNIKAITDKQIEGFFS